MRKTNLWRGLTAVFAVILAVAIYLTFLLYDWEGLVNIALNIKVPTVEADGDTMYYDTGYELSDAGLEQMLADSDKHDVQTMEEGAVLLKNDGNALPLAVTERKVTLFGRAVADPLYKGRSGGASRDPNRLISLYNALKAENFVINDTLFNAYAASSTKRVLEGATADSTGAFPTEIGEEDSSFYTEALKASYASDFNDVAIVMFAREAGEGGDLSKSDKDGLPALRLHKQEADLLKMIKASGKFDKTIVLINSSNAMELGWLFDEQYGVDAALWIGGTGLKGFTGVANVLVGKADPSGRFTDTYAADSLSSAAAQNSGAYKFANDNFNRSYLIEAEGVYSGFKYYETRYQDLILGVNNADSVKGKGAFSKAEGGWNYADEMVFPFGYGSSYASFTQTLESVEWDKTAHTVTATVKVRNDGVPAGSNYTGKSKSVVELYVQLPYESGMAEKSAIQLVDFGKTKALAAGEEDTLVLTASDYVFATYDMEAVNGADTSKKGCYVFDEGDYYFAIGNDSHDALNNVLAAREATGMYDAHGNPVAGDVAKTHKVTLAELDNTTYAASAETGNPVCNLFDNVDINYWYEGENKIEYLTRDNWNTFPQSYEGLVATQAMIDMFNDKTWEVPSNAPSYESFTLGAPVTIKFVELKDLEWDDPKWETFLNQLTLAELCNMIGEDFKQVAITSVGKPQNGNCDGPSGTQGNYRYGNKGSATQHVNEVVAASSWNKELLAERGKFIACDCAFVGTSEIYGPGANLHRTPYSGRNFEYYSEDGIFSYYCGIAQTQGMQKYGLTGSIKHFAGNDQETGRQDMHNFMTEQKMRQDPLKAFEGAYRAEGGALSSMMSYTSFGMQSDFYSDKAVLTDLVRGEWGWKGFTITDNVKADKNISAVEALIAGTDTFNAGPHKGREVRDYLANSSNPNRGYVMQCLRQANKRFFYAISRTNLVNGLTVDTEVTDFIPWWKPAIITVNCLIGAAAIGCGVMFVLGNYVFKKKEETDEN